MHRFYSPSGNISNNKIIISDKEEARHLRSALRIKANEEVAVFDERGNEYLCLVQEISKEVTLAIKKRILNQEKDDMVKITIACAIPKKGKMDDIVDKLTQLGVERIIPLLTERVVIKLDKQKRALRLERWKKIAISAVKQSQRRALPVIEPATEIKELLSRSGGYDLKLMPTLTEGRQTMKEVFTKNKAKNILALIGPEGDFTPEEVNLAKKAGCIPVSLGEAVLRVDTAAISAASFIKFYYEDH